MHPIFAVLLAAALLAGCTRSGAPAKSAAPLSLDYETLPDDSLESDTSALSQLDLGDLNLSGQSLAPDGLDFSSEKPKGSTANVSVISARMIPVADKEGKTVVGWRIVGELANTGTQSVPAGQIIVGLTPEGGGQERTLLPEPTQPGGFLPISPNERAVFDVILSSPESSSKMTVGLRQAGDAELKRLTVSDLEFVKRTSGGAPVFVVRGRITNTTSAPVRDILVRFWATVHTDVPAADAKSREEVVAVGTWRAPQEVLASSQARDFETELTPLTLGDRDLMASGSASLSAHAGGKDL